MGSMSKSDKLDRYNLFEWVNGQEDSTKTRSDKGREFATIKGLEAQLQEGNELCQLLCHGTSKMQWDQLVVLLQRHYPRHHAQFVGGVDEDGFVRVGMKRRNFFKYWKYGGDLKDRENTEQSLYGTAAGTHSPTCRPLNELLSPDADIWGFSKNERALVLDHWESQLRQDWIDELIARAQGYQEALGGLEALRSEFNRRLLDRVDVIGLTTTGLARYAPLLDRIEAKTLICEEAGEVLEVFLLC